MSDLSYATEWNSVVVLENTILTNQYKCELFMDVETDNGEDQNVAFERIKIMLNNIFEDAVLINMFNPLLPMLKNNFEAKIITLPLDPLDLVIANIIYHKINSICEGRLHVGLVKLSSSQGENITVYFDDEFAEEANMQNPEIYSHIEEKPWWHRNDASHSDWFESFENETKYHKHQVDWEGKQILNSPEDDATMKNKANWNPTVIDGGKETKH